MLQSARRTGADRRRVDAGPPSSEPERRSDAAGRRATDALKMACPFCGHSESSVVKSRGLVAVDAIRRRRECASCHERFPTGEWVDRDCLEQELRAQGKDLPAMPAAAAMQKAPLRLVPPPAIAPEPDPPAAPAMPLPEMRKAA